MNENQESRPETLASPEQMEQIILTNPSPVNGDASRQNIEGTNQLKLEVRHF